LFFFSSRRRHTRFSRDWSSDVCSSDLSSQYGGALITCSAHILCTHPNFVHHFLSESAVKKGTQTEPFIMDINSSTRRKERHSISQVDNIILIDNPISIDILILGIASKYPAISIPCENGFSIEIPNNFAVQIPSIGFF